jgi:C-terminal peptidase prc
MTKAVMTGLLGVCLWAATSALPARAASVEEPPQTYIVLVGIDSYVDAQIKSRKNAEADAKALYDLFTSKNYLDADADHVKLLLGTKPVPGAKRPSELASKDNILKELRWAVTNAKANDLVVFAFFGEGAPLGDRTCFFATDSTFKDRAKDSLAAADLEHEFEALKSQRFVAFVDVNFKGFDPGKEVVTEPKDPSDLYKIFLGNEDKEDHAPPPGRVVFLASNGLSPTIDLDGDSLFDHLVVEGLKGAADKDGYEADGLITTDELSKYLEKQLPEMARQKGKTKEEKEQMALVLGGRGTSFPITHNPAAMVKAQERLDKFAALAKDKKVTAEEADEGLSLLTRMPKLKALQELRKTYQQYVDGALTLDQFHTEVQKIKDSTKLKPSEAASFATKIIDVARILEENYVKKVGEGEMIGWAVRGMYKRLEEKKIPADVKERLDKVKDLSEADLITLLKDARQKLGKREDLSDDKDVELALQQLMSHLDPYTNYIDKETVKAFEQQTQAQFSGIGIQIRKDVARDMLLVVTPLKGSPAYRAGLKAGDLITTITRDVDSEGKKLPQREVLPTKGLALSDAVKKILGQPGTEVLLTVEREGEKEPIEFKLKRGNIEVETVLGVKRKSDDSWDYVIDPENRICYIRLVSFAENTAKDLKAAIADLIKDGGVKGFVLDLRFNPGGYLKSAVEISDLFIDDGVIVTIRPRVGPEDPKYGKHDGSLLDFPMAVLVNSGSASASEIVSACLQDHKRAVVIGERSYGKGSVQNILKFPQTGGRIKLTTATYWRPSGKNINKASTKGTEEEEWGVLPDKGFVVKLTRTERDQLAEAQRDAEIIQRRDAPPKEKDPKPEFKDRQLDTALDYLRGQIKTASKSQPKKSG